MTLTLVSGRRRIGPVDVLNQQVMARVADAVSTGAALLETVAKRNAPALTGRLRRSITRQRIAASGLYWQVGVPKDSPAGAYAPAVEFGRKGKAGRPYLIPAAEATRSQYHQMLRAALRDATESVR